MTVKHTCTGSAQLQENSLHKLDRSFLGKQKLVVKNVINQSDLHNVPTYYSVIYHGLG